MTIYFAGNSLEDFEWIYGDPSEYIQSNTHPSFDNQFYDRTILNNCLKLANIANNTDESSDRLKISLEVKADNLYLHYFSTLYSTSYTDRYDYICFYEDDVAWLRIKGLRNTDPKLEIFDGVSAWSDVGALPFTYRSSPPWQIDMHVSGGESGSFRLYMDKELVVEYSINLGASAGINRITKAALDGSNSSSYYQSGVIVADEPTLEFLYVQKSPTSDGTLTDGTGTYAEVSEKILNKGEHVLLPSVGDVHTFKGDSRDFAAMEVKQVQVSSYSNVGITGPQLEQLAIRQDGVDYFSDDITKSLGYTQSKWVMTTNPATGLPWSPAEAGSADLEFGFKATD